MDIRNLPLKSKFKSHLIKANFLTSTEIFQLPPATLAKRTKLPLEEISELLLDLAIGLESLPQFQSKTVTELLEEEGEGWFTTGDTGFDKLLGNGIHVGQITEITGQAASGKSHFALQLSLMVQLPIENAGLNGGALIISSEGTMASPRLLAMAKTVTDRLNSESLENSFARNEWDFMDNVIFAKAEDPESLDNLLSFHLPAIIESYQGMAENSIPLEINSETSRGRVLDHPSDRNRPPLPPLPIKLIVIDSIAALFRISHDNDSTGFIQRSKDLGMISDKLKRLGKLYGCAIVVINQVSTVFETFDFRLPPSDTLDPAEEEGNRQFIPAHEQYNLPGLLYNRFQIKHFSGQTKRLRLMAALGYNWSNLVNTRLMLSRTGKRLQGDGEEDILIRKASLVFSPNAPRASMNYTLQEKSGLVSMGLPVVEEIRKSSEQSEEEDSEEEGVPNGE